MNLAVCPSRKVFSPSHYDDGSLGFAALFWAIGAALLFLVSWTIVRDADAERNVDDNVVLATWDERQQPPPGLEVRHLRSEYNGTIREFEPAAAANAEARAPAAMPGRVVVVVPTPTARPLSSPSSSSSSSPSSLS